MTLTFSEAINAKLKAEQAQSDHDHHVPTYGAMSGHVIANLLVLARKLQQFAWTTSGAQAQTDQGTLLALRTNAQTFADRLVADLAAQGEVFPTTTAEFHQYTMLEEAEALKFTDDETKLAAVVTDLDTCQLFVDRAIPLAQQADAAVIAVDMLELQRWHEQTILQLQRRLGRDVKAGRDLED